MKSYLAGAFLALTLAFGASQASALTLDFSDESGGILGGGLFQLTTDHPSGNPTVNSGNCAIAPCLEVTPNNNPNVTGGEIVTLSRVGGGTFSVTEFWFQFLGRALDNTLRVTGGSSLVDFVQTSYPHNNGGQTVSVAGLFDNITSISFQNLNRGSVRIDDIEVSIAPVPVPAAGLLLLTALGGMAFWRRRTVATA
ncbi:VPLPA-CTERM sorting domain-containing protein [Roseibacterium sp. SDUM158016]|uniref:VPLPA-CTERM sorting domain-containing protein n=1 Tax=Roseicyclus sediminis TaxID=2980997 RepID=UPI0021D3AA91|nr:VPLPA-CTERM sorting domain-containing protein [Roseibacterium sp. SDUM158016]MCU4653551.1 VPLPA-CTERM sorting domain-containing protein [Roseibacterium sp. SDUM158016]